MAATTGGREREPLKTHRSYFIIGSKWAGFNSTFVLSLGGVLPSEAERYQSSEGR